MYHIITDLLSSYKSLLSWNTLLSINGMSVKLEALLDKTDQFSAKQFRIRSGCATLIQLMRWKTQQSVTHSK